mmetsp:Transcript_5118/g.5975  ORF Transcript_5118/g.5975 Transcript_5118/m.5975 type:complete len:446 (+) Transcript_5118:216-1553(+)
MTTYPGSTSIYPEQPRRVRKRSIPRNVVTMTIALIAAACVNPTAAVGGNYGSDVPNRIDDSKRWTRFINMMNQGDRNEAWERGLNDKPLIAMENLNLSPIEAIDTRRLSVTNTPTIKPSNQPTTSLQPSDIPSPIPSTQSSTAPSTTSPSTKPSASNAPTHSLEVIVPMLGSFDNLEPLSANAKVIFETVTADTITAYFNKEFNSSAFDVLAIRTRVVTMEKHSFSDFSSYATASTPNDPMELPTLPPVGLRNLKLAWKGVDSSSVSRIDLQSENDLLIAFDVAISIRTATIFTQIKWEQIQTRLKRNAYKAFKFKKKRTRYIFALQEYEKEEEAFDAINRVAMMVAGEEVVVPPSPSPDVKKKFWRTIYAPIVIGVGVFLFLCCLYIFWRRKRGDSPSVTVVPNQLVSNQQVSSKISWHEDEFAEDTTVPEIELRRMNEYHQSF